MYLFIYTQHHVISNTIVNTTCSLGFIVDGWSLRSSMVVFLLLFNTQSKTGFINDPLRSCLQLAILSVSGVVNEALKTFLKLIKICLVIFANIIVKKATTNPVSTILLGACIFYLHKYRIDPLSFITYRICQMLIASRLRPITTAVFTTF